MYVMKNGAVKIVNTPLPGPVHRNLLQGDPREPKDCRVIPVFQDVMDSTEESVTEEPPEDPENL